MAELELYLLRHAHAGQPADWAGDDAERPLTAKGRRQATALGLFLTERAVAPDAIVSSPLLRALETARLVADALGIGVATDDRLAGRLDLDVLTDVLEAADDDDPLAKGALARFDTSLPLVAGNARLRWLLPPEVVAEHAG